MGYWHFVNINGFRLSMVRVPLNSVLSVKTNVVECVIIASQAHGRGLKKQEGCSMENSELITKALQYINSANQKSDMSVDDVASHAGFSTNYFNRIFFAHTGFNIMEYVRFSRLKKAARLLRGGDYTDILSLALDCGYEAHESFSRAFKAQYGVSPTEYQKKYESTEAFYGDFFNDTVGARLVHEFSDFKIADRDEVTDYSLETNALKYCCEAVNFRVNGGAALYNGDSFRDGFIWFTEWDGRFEGDIICDDWGKIAEYLRIFSDDRFDMMIFTAEEEGAVLAYLAEHSAGIEIQSVENRGCTYVYTGEPYSITAPDGYSMRLLTFEDYELIADYFEKKFPGRGRNMPRMKHLKIELHQRDVLGNSDHSVFMFGIFKDGELIGVSDGALQGTHGFVINNCVATSFLTGYESEGLYQYAFKFVTNATLERGALPIDDLQTPNTPEQDRGGKFVSSDLGYTFVSCAYLVKCRGR